MDFARSKKLFADYCHEIERSGRGMIWRIEIQERGALHWHGIGIADTKRQCFGFGEEWEAALRRLGAETWDTPHECRKDGRQVYVWSVSSRMAIPGADKHAVHIREGGDPFKGEYLRYLQKAQDHATKSKQGQVPENVGRHWGIVGRKRFVPAKSESKEVSDAAYRRVLRMLQRYAMPERACYERGRLCEWSASCPQRPYGRCLGYRIRRGNGHGQSVWFTRWEVVERLIEWARTGENENRSSDTRILEDRSPSQKQSWSGSA